MTALLVALVIASVGSYLLKLAGVSLPESVLANPTVQRIAGFLPVAMLTALVVVGLADGDGDGRWSFDWPVLAGFGAGGDRAAAAGRGAGGVRRGGRSPPCCGCWSDPQRSSRTSEGVGVQTEVGVGLRHG